MPFFERQNDGELLSIFIMSKILLRSRSLSFSSVLFPTILTVSISFYPTSETVTTIFAHEDTSTNSQIIKPHSPEERTLLIVCISIFNCILCLCFFLPYLVCRNCFPITTFLFFKVFIVLRLRLSVLLNGFLSYLILSYRANIAYAYDGFFPAAAKQTASSSSLAAAAAQQ
jgi:hypothetical protein